MILADTSVWVDFLGKNRLFKIQEDQLLSLTICPPILQEILQGIRNDTIYFHIKESLLSLPRIGDPVELEDYVSAAEIYRIGRRKGYTIRSSIDCLIAALAIREKVPIWHNDRDYDAIARFTDLRIHIPASA